MGITGSFGALFKTLPQVTNQVIQGGRGFVVHGAGTDHQIQVQGLQHTFGINGNPSMRRGLTLGISIDPRVDAGFSQAVVVTPVVFAVP